jgi:hypothetical protein
VAVVAVPVRSASAFTTVTTSALPPTCGLRNPNASEPSGSATRLSMFTPFTSGARSAEVCTSRRIDAVSASITVVSGVCQFAASVMSVNRTQVHLPMECPRTPGPYPSITHVVFGDLVSPTSVPTAKRSWADRTSCRCFRYGSARRALVDGHLR